MVFSVLCTFGALTCFVAGACGAPLRLAEWYWVFPGSLALAGIPAGRPNIAAAYAIVAALVRMLGRERVLGEST